MKPKRKKRKPSTKPDRKTALGRFRAWWLAWPKSWRGKPNLPPARRTEVEYVAFLKELQKFWSAEGIGVLRELIGRAHALEARTIEETYRLITYAFDAGRKLLREDFPTMRATLEPRLALLLERDAVLYGAIVRWFRELGHFRGLLRRLPLIVPPVASFGFNPKRQDLVPGVAEFGLWAADRFAMTFPWRDRRNFLACGGIGWKEPPLADAPFQELSAMVERKWRDRMGDGTGGWNALVLESGKAPVWIGWALHRLLESWGKPIGDVRDPAFVQAHLLQVHKDYREWLDGYFDPRTDPETGAALLADVFPPTGIAFKAPLALVDDRGQADYPTLHRVASFVWYACDRIAAWGTPQRAVRSWKKRAWVDRAIAFIFDNPTASLEEVAAFVGKHPSTIYRHPRISAALKGDKQTLREGSKSKDGDMEGIAEDPEE